MRLRPPEKVVTDAWVEVYEKQSWHTGRTPQEEANALAERLGDVFSNHTDLKHLSAQVRFKVEEQCPDCGHPYEPNEPDAGEGIAGFCAWDGCDLREPEA